MGSPRRIPHPVRRIAPALAVLAALALAACGPVKKAPPEPGVVPVMDPSALNSWQIVGWFEANKPGPPQLTVSIGDLVTYFAEEGRDENVRGDIAFAQSIVETGWFRYGGQVQWWQNNFSGLGACDGCTGGAAFADARTGVRAQIQHLRAYGDPFVTGGNLAHPLVDPRFHLVTPKGKAPYWNQFGSGIWATSPTYASAVISTYNRMRQWWGLPPV